MKNYFECMKIDEDRVNVLTKYASTKGIKCKVESDHNIMYGLFSVKYNPVRTKILREIFNFKNEACKQKFFEVSSNTDTFTSCFTKNTDNFPKKAKNFFKTLNGTC